MPKFNLVYFGFLLSMLEIIAASICLLFKAWHNLAGVPFLNSIDFLVDNALKIHEKEANLNNQFYQITYLYLLYFKNLTNFVIILSIANV